MKQDEDDNNSSWDCVVVDLLFGSEWERNRFLEGDGESRGGSTLRMEVDVEGRS